MGIENFLAFVVTAVIFIITPGIDTVFVLNKSISQGKKAGLYSTLGINSGILVHTVFAALGLSMIVAKSVVIFMAIKYIGAAYLIYLGIAKLMTKKGTVPVYGKGQPQKTSRQNYFSGLVTNILNPKVALFFIAFFPQFINPAQLQNPLPFMLLGGTFALLSTVWFLILTFFAGTFSKKFTEHPKVDYWMNKFSGAVFILMGLKIAFTRK
ncbi:LysE family translocator [Sinomicrobium weinanense]|uniref:LysE family translocator n=1 Tax=Sinomicrobium weinanense TaxID=2842200 RepID=A0A926JP31_9FLAO|nr:LysE family translocator [Sinomicrobium weinanense]MBC9794863.1 LysE family translocator [Sinomicrobium weinanense]MBU3125634.1 LysE family translocator [Sinomicrobium weinanense]